jgi:hypothetical protein
MENINLKEFEKKLKRRSEMGLLNVRQVMELLPELVDKTSDLSKQINNKTKPKFLIITRNEDAKLLCYAMVIEKIDNTQIKITFVYDVYGQPLDCGQTRIWKLEQLENQIKTDFYNEIQNLLK